MTRFVSTAWVTRGSAEFEAGAALRVHALSGRATEAHPMHVYMLEGYGSLQASYIAYLREAHIHLHDASAVMAEVMHEFAALNEIANSYNVRCFVRWMVVERLCPGETLVHLDLDLFFKPNFDEAAAIFAGCEGTFGSPCITVATPEWLRIFRETVGRLISDPAALLAELAFDGTPHRQKIASDQDLTQALERRGGILPQHIQHVRKDWAILVNPLWGPQAVGKPTVYSGDDHLGGLPIMFWHLQNSFADYISRFALIQIFPHPWQKADTKVRLGLPDFRINPSAEEMAFHMLKMQAFQKLERYWRDETALTMPISGDVFELIHTRAWVANAFILEGRFREIFSPDWWWEADGFVKPEPAPPAMASFAPVPTVSEAEAEPIGDTPGMPANVTIVGEYGGNSVIIEPSASHIELVIELHGKGNTVIVRRDCALDAVLIAGQGAHIEIGERTTMDGVRVTAEEGSRCMIGARCLFSNDVRIQASDSHMIFDAATEERLNGSRAIEIGDDVKIGEYTQISGGSVIGAGSVVEPGCLLSGDYPANALIGGRSAKVLRTGIKWSSQAN
jgi:acetyltransferase-like isoleucine patch superfamily enzyme